MAHNEISVEVRDNVGIAMTGASFDAAQQEGITRIEPDIEAMQLIAQEIGFIATDEVLPPLVIVTRDRSPGRRYPADWDQRLPKRQGDPDTGRFFSAGSLETTRPLSFNRSELVKVARVVGATSLTEVIVDWQDEDSHAGDFAAGILMNGRPLDLPPKRSVGAYIKAWGSDAFGDNKRKVQAIDRVRGNASYYRAPFIITRAPRRPQIEE